MRISSIPDEEGYNPMVCKDDFFHIYLDGVNVTKKYFVHTVDDKEDWIGIYKTDNNRKILLNEYNEPETDVIYGDVMIKFKGGKDDV